MNQMVIIQSEVISYDWVIYSIFIIYKCYIWNSISLVQ